jgi:hypothetical protein
LAEEGRKNSRFELNDYGAEIAIQGARVQARILDISVGGAQILLLQGTNPAVNDQITVAFGKGIPDINGQVRRSGNSPANPDQPVIGVEFEAAFDPALLQS